MTYKELKTFLMAFSKGMFPQFGGGGGGQQNRITVKHADNTLCLGGGKSLYMV